MNSDQRDEERAARYLNSTSHTFPMDNDMWDSRPTDLCSKCGIQYQSRSAERCGDASRTGEVLYPSGAAASPGPGPAEARWAEVERMLREQFEEDLAALKPKAIKYGSSDLRIMGRAMEALLPVAPRDYQSGHETMGLEMAVGFYAIGKAARLYGAWERGDWPDEDSWYDLGVYAQMARIIRKTGRWM